MYKNFEPKEEKELKKLTFEDLNNYNENSVREFYKEQSNPYILTFDELPEKIKINYNIKRLISSEEYNLNRLMNFLQKFSILPLQEQKIILKKKGVISSVDAIENFKKNLYLDNELNFIITEMILLISKKFNCSNKKPITVEVLDDEKLDNNLRLLEEKGIIKLSTEKSFDTVTNILKDIYCQKIDELRNCNPQTKIEILKKELLEKVNIPITSLKKYITLGFIEFSLVRNYLNIKDQQILGKLYNELCDVNKRKKMPKKTPLKKLEESEQKEIPIIKNFLYEKNSPFIDKQINYLIYTPFVASLLNKNLARQITNIYKERQPEIGEEKSKKIEKGESQLRKIAEEHIISPSTPEKYKQIYNQLKDKLQKDEGDYDINELNQEYKKNLNQNDIFDRESMIKVLSKITGEEKLNELKSEELVDKLLNLKDEDMYEYTLSLKSPKKLKSRTDILKQIQINEKSKEIALRYLKICFTFISSCDMYQEPLFFANILENIINNIKLFEEVNNIDTLFTKVATICSLLSIKQDTLFKNSIKTCKYTSQYIGTYNELEDIFPEITDYQDEMRKYIQQVVQQHKNYLIDFFNTGKLNHAVIYNFFTYSNENILKKCDEGKKYGEILYYKKDGKIHCAISSDVEEDIKSNNFTGKYPSELLDTFMLEYLDENDKLYTFNFVSILNYLFYEFNNVDNENLLDVEKFKTMYNRGKKIKNNMCNNETCYFPAEFVFSVLTNINLENSGIIRTYFSKIHSKNTVECENFIDIFGLEDFDITIINENDKKYCFPINTILNNFKSNNFKNPKTNLSFDQNTINSIKIRYNMPTIFVEEKKEVQSQYIILPGFIHAVKTSLLKCQSSSEEKVETSEESNEEKLQTLEEKRQTSEESSEKGVNFGIRKKCNHKQCENFTTETLDSNGNVISLCIKCE